MSFEYHQPRTAAEALELAGRLPEAQIIAGGTDLMVRTKQTSELPAAMISLRRVDELIRIENGTRLRIGAAVPLREVVAHPAVVEAFPALVQAIRVFGSPQIRNVATLGGNLCNASPGADSAPPLLIYGAHVELRSAAGTRELTIEDFIRGPGETALRPGEILTAILLERPPPGACSTYVRKGRVQMDLAVVGVAALLDVDGATCATIRLAAGAVAPVPLRLVQTESVVVGAGAEAATWAAARAAAEQEVAPISDVRASESYRRHLTGVLVERALAELAAAASGGGS